MENRRSFLTMFGGAILAAWIPFWKFVSALGTFDLMRTASGHPSIGMFFLPAGLADGLTVVGIGMIVYSVLTRQKHGGQMSATKDDHPNQISALRDALAERDKRLAVINEELYAVKTRSAKIALELVRYREAEEEREQEKQRCADLLKNAPQILIEYVCLGSGRENLLFTNDGETTALNITLEPLSWTEKRLWHLYHAIPALSSKHRDECQAALLHALPQGHNSVPLADFLRSTSPDAVTSVVANYESPDGEKFSREFALAAFSDGRIIWQPGPVKLRHSA